ncbi:MAG: peptidylprolyl isomerase [Nocardioides sp.]|nr:peptidylprolyl isomerase [Nocardioides sp.]
MRLRPLAASVAVLALPLVTAACGGDDETAADVTGASVECAYPAGGSAAKDVEPPAGEASAEGETSATITTDQGDVPITLDRADAPCTVNSFVSLAEQGYFDGTTCHRLTSYDGLEVLQCGDPSGTGAGGPGYSFADELDALDTTAATVPYPAGTLAMANAGADTNGSQFFLVYGDSELPPAYTQFGTVSADGLAVVEQVAAGGSNDAQGVDGAPNRPVTITGVSVD